MSWVTCDPKSTIRILSWPASRSEPAPRTREESRMVIQTYVRPGGPPVKALNTVHHSLKRLFPRDGRHDAWALAPRGPDHRGRVPAAGETSLCDRGLRIRWWWWWLRPGTAYTGRGADTRVCNEPNAGAQSCWNRHPLPAATISTATRATA